MKNEERTIEGGIIGDEFMDAAIVCRNALGRSF
jgi:hypothetical protein